MRTWGWPDRLGVALVAVCAGLAALIETLLVPLYIGSIVAPVAVVLAFAGNALLPRLARSLVPTTAGALAPFAAWLIVMVGFGVVSRPEGDVVLPASPTAVEWVTYLTLLGGALVGTVTVVSLAPPPLTKEQAAAKRGT